MRKDFAVLILTHGRPDKVYTARTLREAGYSGPIYLVIDDEDPAREAYRETFGDMVVEFSKDEAETLFDTADNFAGRGSVVYARNACFPIARELGFRYFAAFDDDYTGALYTFREDLSYWRTPIKNLDRVFDIMLRYFEAIPAKSIAMAQGGDFIGGGQSKIGSEIALRRKCMNTFLCDVERPFEFPGKINEDVNAYTANARRGELYLTVPNVGVNQVTTQANAGGMTELYLDRGTYVKSFYSVIFAPSCVTIGEMGSAHRRLHHRVDWNAAAPKIVREEIRKIA